MGILLMTDFVAFSSHITELAGAVGQLRATIRAHIQRSLRSIAQTVVPNGVIAISLPGVLPCSVASLFSSHLKKNYRYLH